MRKKFDEKVLKELAHEKFTGRVEIEPAVGGIVTNVYKVKYKSKTFYLRITPYEDQSYQPEVIAHRKILAKGAKIPEIIYHRNHCPEIDNRSFMIMKKMAGKPISNYSSWENLKEVFLQAGEDIAKVNTILVNGFGWIKRKEENINQLKAPRKNYPDYILENYESNLEVLVNSDVITQEQKNKLIKIKGKFRKHLNYDKAYLSHGDFDVTHIYSKQNKYRGIIDFGDICGASPIADLAHFKFFSQPTKTIFPWLLKGYKRITPLPKDFDLKLKREGILISLKKLSYIAKTLPNRIDSHRAIPKLKKNIKDLERI